MTLSLLTAMAKYQNQQTPNQYHKIPTHLQIIIFIIIIFQFYYSLWTQYHICIIFINFFLYLNLFMKIMIFPFFKYCFSKNIREINSKKKTTVYEGQATLSQNTVKVY
jgi:hypothetical protein